MGSLDGAQAERQPGQPDEAAAVIFHK
jgi:hypothetical protein